jgi:hypothetical protein
MTTKVKLKTTWKEMTMACLRVQCFLEDAAKKDHTKPS